MMHVGIAQLSDRESVLRRMEYSVEGKGQDPKTTTLLEQRRLCLFRRILFGVRRR
jgi:hypothetical protein